MWNRSLLLPSALVTIVAVSSLAGCQKSATVGGFALDVPGGWTSASDEPNVLALGTDNVEWTFVVMSFTTAEVEGDKSLMAVGKEIARAVAEEDQTVEEDTEMRFEEPKPWAQAGLEGILMEGEIVNPQITMRLALLVVIAGDEYLVALGFRGPHAKPKHDKAMRALLDSIRKA